MPADEGGEIAMDDKQKVERKYSHLKHRQRTTNPEHVAPSQGSPTTAPPLRIAERYERNHAPA
jgi:hypothetical protein